MKFSNHGFSQDLLAVAHKIMSGETIEEKKKLDPVGKEDADIDNDGDTDKSDQYLHNRRKAIKKAMKEEKCECNCGKSPCVECGKDHHNMKEEVEQVDEISAKLARKAAASSQAKSFEYGSSAYGPGTDKESDRLERKADKARAHVQKRQGDKGVKKVDKMTGKLIYGESKENAPSKENGGIAHQCATHVQHATYGEGRCVPGMHTIVETEDGEGFVTHYDVMFQGENGPYIQEDVSVNELKIVASESHKHKRMKETYGEEMKSFRQFNESYITESAEQSFKNQPKRPGTAPHDDGARASVSTGTHHYHPLQSNDSNHAHFNAHSKKSGTYSHVKIPVSDAHHEAGSVSTEHVKKHLPAEHKHNAAAVAKSINSDYFG